MGKLDALKDTLLKTINTKIEQFGGALSAKNKEGLIPYGHQLHLISPKDVPTVGENVNHFFDLLLEDISLNLEKSLSKNMFLREYNNNISTHVKPLVKLLSYIEQNLNTTSDLEKARIRFKIKEFLESPNYAKFR